MADSNILTYPAKWRVKKADGTWETDRREYYRLRWLKFKDQGMAAQRRAYMKAMWADPERKAAHLARIEARKKSIQAEYGFSAEKLRRIRRAIRDQVGDDRDALLAAFAKENVLTPREKKYVENRKPLGVYGGRGMMEAAE